MEFTTSSMPFWEVSQTPMNISQIADDDFLTLLQKQFPTDIQVPFDLTFPGYNNPTAVNPQNLSDFTFPISQSTPPSSDSGNSPVSTTNDNDDRSLKRKASDERMDVEPASKAAHTTASSNTNAPSGHSNKKTSSRRKSGNPTQDELRLLKRKEQNRAAQRAFRERKEKHVKDLEDKVEELEMKNQRTESENENLRDLLSRLQEENVQLKKKQQLQLQHSPSPPFTFAISKDSPATVGNNVTSPLQKDSPSASPPVSTVSPQTNYFITPFTGSEFDFGSLIPFDPAVLNTLDDTYTSPSASDDVMNLDFGFGKPNGQTFNILASDPASMSFAEPSPPDSASVSTPMNTINPFDFSALDQWSRSGPRSNGGDAMQTFDELFGGSSNFLPSSSGIDFTELMKKSQPVVASSPVSHTNLNGSGPSDLNSPLTSPSTNSPETPFKQGGGCPKTKEQLSEAISKTGLSSFVVDSPGNSNSSKQCETGPIPFLKKSTNKDAPMVMCRGSSFPKTEQNDKNIEVLSAWRTITSNPQFKDIDINELCTEFTNKAKCDGTKVVLEPSGVTHIIDTLTAKVQQKAAAAGIE